MRYEFLCRYSGGLQTNRLRDFPSDRQAPKNSSPVRPPRTLLHKGDNMIDFVLPSLNRMSLILSHHSSTRHLSVRCWKQLIIFNPCAEFVVRKARRRCRSVICDINIDVIMWNISSVSNRNMSRISTWRGPTIRWLKICVA